MKRALLYNPIWLIIISFAVVSCVDNSYDLNDLDTDEITIGKEINIPLGTGIISASKLLDANNVEEIITDANGNLTALYQGGIQIVPDNIPGLGDQVYHLPSAKFPGLISGSINSDVEFVGNQVRALATIDTGTEIESLERIVLKTGENISFLEVSVSLENLDLYGQGSLSVNVEVPDGFTLYYEGNDSNDFSFEIPLSNSNYSGRFIVPVVDIIPSDNDYIYVQPSIAVKALTNIMLTGDPQVNITASLKNLEYHVIYGQFNTVYNTNSERIDMSGLSDVFIGDNNTLSFADPHIRINTGSNIGVPLDVVLTLLSGRHDGSSPINAQIDGVTIDDPAEYGDYKQAKKWLGANSSTVENGYDFVYTDKLNPIISVSPDYLEVSALITPGARTPMFFPDNATTSIDYEVVVPLSPARDFHAVVEEVIEDAFEDLVEYVFSNGSAEILGEVTNSLPLALTLEMIITDYNGNPIGIEMEPQPVSSCSKTGAASVSSVSFEITERDMPKMEFAKDILLKFTVSGTDQTEGICLNENQELVLDLRLKKQGGIIINN